MIDGNEQRSMRRDSICIHNANITVEPVECDARHPPEKGINHNASGRTKLLGTLRSIHSASAIPIATVPTPARYAKPTPMEDESPSTASAQMNGPTTAAAREDNTIKLKKRPASTSGTRLRSRGRSAVDTPP